MAERIILVRHANAGNPEKWDKNDKLRPLTSKGEQQADWLAHELTKYNIDKLYSSQYLRCWQTLLPLSMKRHIQIKMTSTLNVGQSGKSAFNLCKEGETTVLSTHGDVGPKILKLTGCKNEDLTKNKKGSYWVITIKDDIVDAQYHEPPK